jgi:hypothetical protein
MIRGVVVVSWLACVLPLVHGMSLPSWLGDLGVNTREFCQANASECYILLTTEEMNSCCLVPIG